MCKKRIEWATRAMISQIIQEGVTEPHAVRARVSATIGELTAIDEIPLAKIRTHMLNEIEQIPRRKRASRQHAIVF